MLTVLLRSVVPPPPRVGRPPRARGRWGRGRSRRHALLDRGPAAALQRPRRVPGHHRAGRHVARDDRAGADDGSLTHRHAAEDRGTGPDARAIADARADQLPVLAGLQRTVAVDGAGVLVVHEDDAVADEAPVADLDPVADVGVALDLAVAPDRHAAGDLDERADARPVADLAAVQVRELVDDDVGA